MQIIYPCLCCVGQHVSRTSPEIGIILKTTSMASWTWWHLTSRGLTGWESLIKQVSNSHRPEYTVCYKTMAKDIFGASCRLISTLELGTFCLTVVTLCPGSTPVPPSPFRRVSVPLDHRSDEPSVTDCRWGERRGQRSRLVLVYTQNLFKCSVSCVVYINGVSKDTYWFLCPRGCLRPARLFRCPGWTFSPTFLEQRRWRGSEIIDIYWSMVWEVGTICVQGFF